MIFQKGYLSSFSKDYLQLLVGRSLFIFSQFAFLLVCTRVLSISEVGFFGLAMALCGPVFGFCQLDLRLFISTNMKEEWSPTELFTTQLISAISGLFVLGITLLFAHSFDAGIVVAVVASAKLFESFSCVCYGFHQREQRFRNIAVSEVLRGPVTVLVAGTALYSTGSLVLALAIRSLLWLLTLIAYDIPTTHLAKFLVAKHWLAVSFPRIRKLLSCSAPLGLRTILISLFTNIPRYLIAVFAGEAVLGIYTPASYLLVAMSVPFVIARDAAAPRLASSTALTGTPSLRESAQLLTSVGIIAAVLFGVLAAAAPWTLEFLFGYEYRQAASALRILLFGGFFMALYAFAELLLGMHGKFHLAAVFSLIALTTNLLVCLIWIPVNPLTGAACAFLSSSVILFALALLRVIARVQADSKPLKEVRI